MATPPLDDPDHSGRGKIAAIGVIVLLLAAGFWLVHTLGGAAAIQDCVATGRSDCGQSDTSQR